MTIIKDLIMGSLYQFIIYFLIKNELNELNELYKLYKIKWLIII